MENNVKRLLKALASPNEQGFTLLEMLAAITITAFMLAILSQFLFNGLRLWTKQDRGYQQQHRLKLIHKTLYNDLSTVLVGNYLPEYSVEGDDVKLQFWSEASTGLVLITYSYSEEKQAVYRSEGFWGQEESPEIPLFKEITKWKFEYYDPEWKNWVAQWKPDSKMNIPALVRVSICSKTGDLGTMTFPLKAWHKEDQE